MSIPTAFTPVTTTYYADSKIERGFQFDSESIGMLLKEDGGLDSFYSLIKDAEYNLSSEDGLQSPFLDVEKRAVTWKKFILEVLKRDLLDAANSFYQEASALNVFSSISERTESPSFSPQVISRCQCEIETSLAQKRVSQCVQSEESDSLGIDWIKA